jgi:aromatic-amino-acid transaminase
MFVATPVSFGDDPVFELHREAIARRASGRDCINATLGVLMDDDGALAVLPSVAEAMRESSPIDWAPYAGASGTDEFLTAVLDDCLGAFPLMRANALAIATPGATGALRCALTTFLGRDQACLTSSYHWGTYSIIAQAGQRRIVTFELFDQSRRRFNVADFERKLRQLIAEQGRALVVINDPCHNPTGYTMTARDWAAVAGVLDRCSSLAPITVVLDSVYAAFSKVGTGRALAELQPLLDKLLLVMAWSASKSLTCYGLRVGALVAVCRDPAERQRIQSTLAGHACGTWANCNRGGLAAVARLLTDPRLRRAVERDRGKQIELLRKRSELFRAAAAKHDLVCPPYGGGFFTAVFVNDPQHVAALLRARGIYVVPMPGSLRIALSAVRTDDVAELARALRAAIDEPDSIRPVALLNPFPKAPAA